MPGSKTTCGVALVRLATFGLAACLLHGCCFASGRGSGSTSLRGGRALMRAESLQAEPLEEQGSSAAGGAIVGGALGFIFAGPAVAVLGVAIGSVAGYASAQSAQDADVAIPRPGFDPTKEVGAMEPLGYWDPVGFMKKEADGDYYSFEWQDETTFRQYRQAELKHGRLAMVALTGMIAEVFARFPAFGGVEYQLGPDGLGAGRSEVAGGIGIIFLLVSFIELENGEGEFYDPLNVKEAFYLGKDFDEFSDDLRNKELAHGRLAMSTVLTLWLYEYGADRPPSSFLNEPSPLAYLGLVLLFVFWSPYVMDASEQPSLSSPDAKTGVALPEAAESQAKASVLTTGTVSGKTVFRFAAAS